MQSNIDNFSFAVFYSGPGKETSDRLVSCQLCEAAQSQHQQDNTHGTYPS